MRFVTCAAVLFTVLACGGDGVSPAPQPAPTGPVVTTILVKSPTGPLQVGATFALSADVRDQSDLSIAGKTLTWSTANAAVATVSSEGVVTAVGPGNTTISATTEGKTGSATITVAQPPVFAVTITPLAGPAVAGETTLLAVVVTDRNGNVLIGRRVTWSTSAPIVAAVDGNGQMNALSPGVTTITALSEGVSGTVAVTVTAPAGSVAPTIASISPAMLTPGTTATLNGTGFLGVTNTAVTIAGMAATVLGTTATQLMIAVPTVGLPCQSTQPVPVVVATVGGAATTNHPLAVARTRALAVGESFVTDASGDIGCNELPAGGGYVVSVFNGSVSASTTTRFELRGIAGGPLASRLPPEQKRPVIAAPTRSLMPTATTAAEQAHLDHLEAERSVLQRLGAPHRARAPSFSRAASVPGSLTVGTTTQLKFHYSSCTAAGASPVTARVVYVGAHSVVLEDVAGPLAGTMDAELIAMAQEFETISYPLLLNFGDPFARVGGTNVNGQILMLFTPKVNNLATNLLGFVSACDFYPMTQDATVAGSNEALIFYARTVTDSTPNSTSLNGVSEWRREMPATMIHEAKHLTSYAERLARSATQFEQVWLEEATAQLASEMFGRAIHGNQWRGDATYRETVYCESRPATAGCAGGVIAMSNHFAFLANYMRTFETKSILSGAEDSDIYGSSWLFARWLVDTYGGSDEGAFLRRLVQTATLSGAPNVEAASGRTFPQLLAEFTLMLAADNVPTASGPYVEPSWNLPDVFAGLTGIDSRPPAPLAMRQSTDGNLSVSARNVKGGGAVLVQLDPIVGGTTQLLELKSTPVTPLATTSPVGMAVLRVK